jgi:hypothetical protein
MTRLYHIPSRTVRGLTYELRAGEDGVTCDCPSGMVRGYCRHATLVEEVEKAGLQFAGEVE